MDCRQAEETLRLEAIAKRALELSEQVVIRDDILSSVAHDLLGPLSAASMNIGIMLRDPSCDDRLRVGLQRTRSTLDHSVRLVKDLIDTARIRSGKLSVNIEELDVHRFFVDTCEALCVLCEEKGVELVREFACLEGTRVLCDSTRLFQALTNMLTNAIRFSVEGGRVTLGVADAGNKVMFFVSDNGRGIQKEDLSRIFDQWWSTNDGGSGLGLSIVKRIADSMSGEVGVESEVGRGSTFWIKLPKPT